MNPEERKKRLANYFCILNLMMFVESKLSIRSGFTFIPFKSILKKKRLAKCTFLFCMVLVLQSFLINRFKKKKEVRKMCYCILHGVVLSQNFQ